MAIGVYLACFLLVELLQCSYQLCLVEIQGIVLNVGCSLVIFILGEVFECFNEIDRLDQEQEESS